MTIEGKAPSGFSDYRLREGRTPQLMRFEVAATATLSFLLAVAKFRVMVTIPTFNSLGRTQSR
jgi:hypothetical protein